MINMAVNNCYLRKIQIRSLPCNFCILLTASFIFFTPVAYSAQPTRVCFQNNCVKVETANTDIKRARGLQGRDSLEAGQGMLFIFPQESGYDFWMKDTLIPLDMIWMDKHFKVVDVKENVPPCEKDPCEVYVPIAVAKYVLEINAQGAKNYGIKIGDAAVFK